MSVIAIISVILPVFGLLGLGFLAAHFRFMAEHSDESLSRFVFAFCLPALIFRTMERAVLPQAQPWGYWISFFVACAIAWGLAMLIARRSFRTNHAETVVAGFSAGQSNTAFVGIPLILNAYGDSGAVPLFLLMAVHLPITMTSAVLLMEGRDRIRFGILGRRLLFNPMMIGLVGGVVWRATGLGVAGPLNTVVSELADASIPCALFAMGLALHRFGLKGQMKLVGIITFLKLILHPSLVWLFAFKVFTMPPVWAGVAVLFAAMPTGINAYLFAGHHKAAESTASSAIAISTGLAPFSAALWLWLLHAGVH
ncbi:MAG TPA: AEC family transporter [Beijerinckia sp.]|nr:AEC family transporter [Beijerinckia sp.]